MIGYSLSYNLIVEMIYLLLRINSYLFYYIILEYDYKVNAVDELEINAVIALEFLV